jgi:hypothetical protein
MEKFTHFDRAPAPSPEKKIMRLLQLCLGYDNNKLES